MCCKESCDGSDLVLCTVDRLKLFNDNRDTFETMNPPLRFDENQQTSTEANSDSQRNDANKQPTELEPALRVLRQRKRGGRTEYLVLFEDRTSNWTQSVSPALIESFLMTKQKQTKRRRCKKNNEIVSRPPPIFIYFNEYQLF